MIANAMIVPDNAKDSNLAMEFHLIVTLEWLNLASWRFA